MVQTYQTYCFPARHTDLINFFEDQERIWNLQKVLPGDIPDLLFVDGNSWGGSLKTTRLPRSKKKVLFTGEICSLGLAFDIICCPNQVSSFLSRWKKFIYFPIYLFGNMVKIPEKPKTKNILFLYSNPFAYYRRYLCSALQKISPVDCPGTVLNNCSGTAGGRYKNWEEEKKDLLSSYQYCIAGENSCTPWYITEKFWDCLEVGTIPIYLWSPNVSSFVPEECYIDVYKYIPKIYFIIPHWILYFFPPKGYRLLYWFFRRIEWWFQRVLGYFIPWNTIAKKVLSDAPTKRPITSEELEKLKKHKAIFFDTLKTVLFEEH